MKYLITIHGYECVHVIKLSCTKLERDLFNDRALNADGAQIVFTDDIKSIVEDKDENR